MNRILNAYSLLFCLVWFTLNAFILSFSVSAGESLSLGFTSASGNDRDEEGVNQTDSVKEVKKNKEKDAIIRNSKNL